MLPNTRNPAQILSKQFLTDNSMRDKRKHALYNTSGLTLLNYINTNEFFLQYICHRFYIVENSKTKLHNWMSMILTHWAW